MHTCFGLLPTQSKSHVKLVCDVDGAAALPPPPPGMNDTGIESNVSHCVVITMGAAPEDERRWCTAFGGKSINEFSNECRPPCWWGGAAVFLLLSKSRVSTYFCTLLTFTKSNKLIFLQHQYLNHQIKLIKKVQNQTCIFLCNLTSPSATMPSNLSNWFMNNSIKFTKSFSTTFPPLETSDSIPET